MLRLYNLFVHLLTIGTVVWLMFFSSAHSEPLAGKTDDCCTAFPAKARA